MFKRLGLTPCLLSCSLRSEKYLTKIINEEKQVKHKSIREKEEARPAEERAMNENEKEGLAKERVIEDIEKERKGKDELLGMLGKLAGQFKHKKKMYEDIVEAKGATFRKRRNMSHLFAGGTTSSYGNGELVTMIFRRGIRCSAQHRCIKAPQCQLPPHGYQKHEQCKQIRHGTYYCHRELT